METIKNPIQRAAALLLAVIMALGLLPTFAVEAQAEDVTAPSSIKLTSLAWGQNYVSPTLNSSCMYHPFTFNVNGKATYGFCMDHKKAMRNSNVGDYWKNPQKYAGDSDMKKLLDWFYTKYYKSLELEKAHPGINYEDAVKEYPGYMNNDVRKWNNAWVQACLWVEQAKKMPTDRDGKIAVFIKEMNAVLKNLYPSSDFAKMSDTDKTEWFNTIFDYEYGPDTINSYDYYIYYHSTSSIQPILVPVGENLPDIEPKYVYIMFDKVDENGAPLKDAVFNVWNEDFTRISDAQITTTGVAGAVYKIALWNDFERGTIFLVEDSAPAPYERLEAAFSFYVDVEVNKTEDNPAKLGAPIENTIGDSDVVKKIDRATGAGIGPATFNFKGQAKDGSPVDVDFQCDVTGTLELQWTDPAKDKYIKPGTYTVTEKVPPPGYEKTNETQQLTLDIDAQGKATQNGPITFANVPTTIPDVPKGVVKKIDAATNKGVGPATFNFKGQAKDGTAVDADFQCDATGSLELQWTNPAGDKYIKPGQYTVTEKIPPEGYTKTNETFHLVLDIDAQGRATNSGPITFANNKKKKLLIKKISDDGTPLDGAVFNIYRDGLLMTTLTTANGGQIAYNGDGNGIETGLYTIEEVTPPDGFLLPEVHSQNIYVDA